MQNKDSAIAIGTSENDKPMRLGGIRRACEIVSYTDTNGSALDLDTIFSVLFRPHLSPDEEHD